MVLRFLEPGAGLKNSRDIRAVSGFAPRNFYIADGSERALAGAGGTLLGNSWDERRSGAINCAGLRWVVGRGPPAAANKNRNFIIVFGDACLFGGMGE